ncbi:MAG: ribonuclease HII [Clostridiaceae bacterium]|nr:ribonuclease HII [Clostridiaceae bacterium]
MDFSIMSIKQIDAYLNGLPVEELEKYMDMLKKDTRSSASKLAEKYLMKINKYYNELERLQRLNWYENRLYEKGEKYIAGVDEAGRGPLAGPVFAAAVILPPNTFIEGIDDSKKISEKKREQLYPIIISKAISYRIVSVSEKEIDSMGILKAVHRAMIEAVTGLEVHPGHVLIDGNEVKDMPIPHTALVKGDSLSISIAAASILAKVSRDRYIKQLDALYPQYGFGKHKGYGTREHIEAIKKFGMCPIHRKSFLTKINM